MECSDRECKQEFRESLRELQEDLYGDGPEGTSGVYGVLKKKVSWRVLILLVSPFLGVIGYFAAFTVTHESRMAKVETTVARNTEVIHKSVSDIESIREESRRTGEKILHAIRQLKVVD